MDEIRPSTSNADDDSEEDSLSSTLIDCGVLFSDVSERYSKSFRLCHSLLRKSCSMFKELNKSKKEIKNAVQAAALLQLAFGSSGRVHLVIESELTQKSESNPKVHENNGQRMVSILPIFSPSLTVSLLEDVHDVDDYTTFSSQFVNLFARAEKLASLTEKAMEGEIPRGADRLKNKSPEKKCTFPKFTIPHWFLTNRFESKGFVPQNGSDILCGYDIFSKLKSLSSEDIESVYGEFFTMMHEKSKLMGLPNYNKGKVFKDFTPPWLRIKTNFLTGKRHTKVHYFDLGYLPNKRWCTKRDRREHCRAILAEWLRREPSTRDLLLFLLRRHGIEISEAEISRSILALNIRTTIKDVLKGQEKGRTTPCAGEAQDSLPNRPPSNGDNVKVGCAEIRKSEVNLPVPTENAQRTSIENERKNEVSTEQKEPKVPSPYHAAAEKHCDKTCFAEMPRCPMLVDNDLHSSGAIRNVSRTENREIVHSYKNASEPKGATIENRGSSLSQATILVILGDYDVRPEDIDTLQEGRFLNSVIINSFLFLLKSETTAVLNSWFYTRITNGRDNNQSFQHLSRWILKSDMEKVYSIFIPLHSEELKHWALLWVDKKTAKVHLYDSLPDMDAFPLASATVAEWCEFVKGFKSLENWPDHWKGTSQRDLSVRQRNGSECGVFTCVNAYFLSTGILTQHFPVFETQRMRDEISQSVLSKEIKITY